FYPPPTSSPSYCGDVRRKQARDALR
ncbi:hypothetical protein AZ014_003207, partial [Klebsiella pneumoniae]